MKRIFSGLLLLALPALALGAAKDFNVNTITRGTPATAFMDASGNIFPAGVTATGTAAAPTLQSGYSLKFTSVAAPGACSLAVTAGGAVDIGAHYYKVTFVTANGETELGTASNVANIVVPGTQAVTLSSIPTGPAGVTQRKIYRTKAAAASTGPYWLLTTIGDNTSAGYIDATADSGLGATDLTYKANTTGGRVFYNTVKGGGINSYNTSWGYGTLTNYVTGAQNIAVGMNALYGAAGGFTGVGNVAVGDYTLYAATSANSNFALGVNSLFRLTSGSNNVLIGANSGAYMVTSLYNVGVGANVLYNCTGSYNTALGMQAGLVSTTGANCTFIGYNAGNTDGTNATSNNLSNATAIGNYAQVQASNACVIGGMGDKGQNVGTGVMAPLAKLHVNQETVGSAVWMYSSTATNSDPVVKGYQQRATTTDATPSNILTYATTTDTAGYATAVVVARRTGGTGGSAGDMAAYRIECAYSNEGGTAALIGTVNQALVREDQAGWECTFTVSSGNLLVTATGAANNNVTWHVSKFEVSDLQQ